MERKWGIDETFFSSYHNLFFTFFTCNITCAAFFNDNDLDGIDLYCFIVAYTNNTFPDADINGDGEINSDDIEKFALELGKIDLIDNDHDGFTKMQGDCNDSNPNMFPGAPEICEDGVDQNCDGMDSNCPAVVTLDVTQLTNNGVRDNRPSVYNGTIAWQRNNGNNNEYGGDYEIVYYDGSIVKQLTNNDLNDSYPSLSQGSIVWQRNFSDYNSDIYLWDGLIITRFTNDIEFAASFPCLYNGKISWQSYSRLTPERGSNYINGSILYWDGIETSKISDLISTNDTWPKVFENKIAWSEDDGNDYEVYLWDGKTVFQLTNNDSDDYNVSLNNYWVAWSNFGGSNSEIFYWNGINKIQLTNNNINDSNPVIFDGSIAWIGQDGNNYMVYYWDGINIYQVATFNGYPMGFSFHGNIIAWSVSDGNDDEIYYVDISPLN